MREMPVSAEKIAVLRATPPPGGAGAAGSSAKASVVADKAAIVRRCDTDAHRSRRSRPPAHGEHRLSEEAHPARRARAPREPLHLDDQDVLPPSGVARRRR